MQGIKKAAKPPKKPAINILHSVLGALDAGVDVTVDTVVFATCAVSFLAATRLSVAVVISVNTTPLVSGSCAKAWVPPKDQISIERITTPLVVKKSFFRWLKLILLFC